MAAFLFCNTALAENIDTNPSANESQQRIEATAAAYNEAVEQAEAAAKAVEDNAKRITELKNEIPKQQKRSEAATRELYKIQQQQVGIVELLLGSESFFDFLSNLEYLNRITSAQLEQIQLLSDMKKELESKQVELERAKSDAETHAAEAKEALAAAQQVRAEAQQQGQAVAHSGNTSLPSTTEQSSRDFTTAPSDVLVSDVPASTNENPDAPKPESSPEPEIVDDGANWMSDEDIFVSEWAARIDNYLAGSPLEGQGATFARAAWNYGVDPRWSPAISCTESTKGRYCFLPYNAWGWGSVSWGSWEEAIDAHVRGLARGYGYTISYEAACKYCPPNADHWYEFTLSEMNRI